MQSRPLVIITTRLPPQICGIGTFSWLLDQHWPSDRSNHRFLVVDASDTSDPAVGSRETEFGSDWRRLQTLLERDGDADILLHYAGRAYQQVGCPFGLPGVLRHWKSKFPARNLVIFFHELPGRLPLTNLHHWVNLCSGRIAGRLAMLADVLITNTREHVQTLERVSGRKDVLCVPVPSNIEPLASSRPERIPADFAVFGLPYGRWQTLQRFDSHIHAWQQTGLLKRLHLIGPSDRKFDVRSGTLIKSYPHPEVVIRHGEISPDEVSQLLFSVQYALTTADELTWSKSTTFMSFLAHQCAIVSERKFDFEPLSYTITPDQVGAVPPSEIQARTTVARHWYDSNADWEVLARRISDAISTLPRRDI